MGIESRSLLHDEGLDLEHLTLGCRTTRQREQLGVRLDEKREALHDELIKAARNLAYFNVRYLTADDLPADPFARVPDGLKCDECKQVQRRLAGGVLKGEHTQECRTGAVLKIVELLDGLQQFAPNAFESQPFIFRQVSRREGGRK